MSGKPMTDDSPLPVIQSLWIGDRLSSMERLCISSFLINGHPFHLYVYDEIENVPAGVLLKDAREIISPDKIFKYRDRNTYAGFSNLFRYKLLLEKGEFWVDTDVVCMSPLNPASDYVFTSAKEPNLYVLGPKIHKVQNFLIKTPAGAEIMEYCYTEAGKRNPAELKWGDTGPRLLKSAVKKFSLQRYVEKAETFSPIHWRNWDRFINGAIHIVWREKLRFALSGTKALHLWNEMWRLNGVNKDGGFPKNCIYEQLKRRYLET
ncbi:MAG: hypothetical protein RIG61_07845 [Deltaproteobacteria bacterium]